MIPPALIGWPGLAVLLTAAALTVVVDLLRERKTSPRRGTETGLILAIVIATVAGAVITLARFDTLTGGLLT